MIFLHQFVDFPIHNFLTVSNIDISTVPPPVRVYAMCVAFLKYGLLYVTRVYIYIYMMCVLHRLSCTLYSFLHSLLQLVHVVYVFLVGVM